MECYFRDFRFSEKYISNILVDLIFMFQTLCFRHASILHSISVVYPECYHGICYQHLSMNVAHVFKTDVCGPEMYGACYAWRKSVFHAQFEKLRRKDPNLAKYLEDIGIERFARSYFPGKR